MANRLFLQTELEILLGSEYVYFQPPASLKMTYPCIRYVKSDIDTAKANDKTYRSVNQYTLTVIDPNPDTELPDRILEHFQMCSFDRFYTSDNLNHYVLTLYY